MINIRTIKNLKNNDGLTLKAGKPINYKSGWQVATEGIECKTAADCMAAIKSYNGNCGVWFADGIYYVDKSHRVDTKKRPLKLVVLLIRFLFLDGLERILLIAEGFGPLFSYNLTIDNPGGLQYNIDNERQKEVFKMNGIAYKSESAFSGIMIFAADDESVKASYVVGENKSKARKYKLYYSNKGEYFIMNRQRQYLNDFLRCNL